MGSIASNAERFHIEDLLNNCLRLVSLQSSISRNGSNLHYKFNTDIKITQLRVQGSARGGPPSGKWKRGYVSELVAAFRRT